MADSRIYDLTQEASIDFSRLLMIDESGLTEAKSISLSTLLRKGVLYEQDDVGNTTTSVSFANYNVIELTISLDITATITNVPDNSRNLLRVIKPAAKIITFAGVAGTTDGIQQGRTTLLYEITSVNGDVIVTQLNRQFSGSLLVGDLTPPVQITITDFDYFKWTINETQCTVEGSLTVDSLAVFNGFETSIANFSITKFNTGYAPLDVYATDGTVIYSANGRIKEDTMYINLGANTSGDPVEIVFSATFRVK